MAKKPAPQERQSAPGAVLYMGPPMDTPLHLVPRTVFRAGIPPQAPEAVRGLFVPVAQAAAQPTDTPSNATINAVDDAAQS